MKDTAKAQVISLMRKMISKEAENKLIGAQVENNVQHNSAIGSADPQPLIPQITSGTDSWQRLGDRVKPKSLRVRGTVSIADGDLYALQQRDIYVRILILSQKNLKTGAAVLAGGVDVAHLLRPNFTALQQTNYGGNNLDISLPINTDLFKVYMDKTVKLSLIQDGGLDQVSRLSARWSYRFKSLPASLTFDNGNGDWANNFAPFLAIGYAYADGTAPDVVTTRVNSNCYAALSYEDS